MSRLFKCIAYCCFAGCWISPLLGQSNNAALPDILAMFKKAQGAEWKQTVSMSIQASIIRCEAGKTTSYKMQSTYRSDHNTGREEWLTEAHSDTAEKEMDRKDLIQRIFDGQRFLQAETRSNGRILATVTVNNREKLTETNNSSSSLGFALDGKIGAIGNLAGLLDSNSSLRLRETPELIDGTSCQVIEAQTPHGVLVMWVSPETGFRPLKYSLHVEKDDLYRGNTPLHESELKYADITVEQIKYQKVGKYQIPVSCTETDVATYPDGKTKSTTITVMRKDIDLNPDFNGLGAFVLKLPEGQRVYDSDYPGIQYEWRNGQLAPYVDEELVKSITTTMASELVKTATQPTSSMASNSKVEPQVVASTTAVSPVVDTERGIFKKSVVWGVAGLMILGALALLRWMSKRV